jgi:aryl-alcohol dehydrogenase-like predicted oxidoreductase
MELALGTVQFGLAYGVAGRNSPLSDTEARSVLEAAARRGVRWLDSATVYGDIEWRLRGLCADLPFSIVSKLPARPADLTGVAAAAFFVDAVNRCTERLRERLRVLLFHHDEDLRGDDADLIWAAVKLAADQAGIGVGVSCYERGRLASLVERYPLSAAQLPGNALDQSIGSISAEHRPPMLQLRSAFLQGLLLMPEEEAKQRLPVAAVPLRRWHTWCGAKGLSRIDAAIGIVKGFGSVSQCVVGVDNVAQFEQIANAWERAVPMQAPELACVEREVIDPRLWRIVR